MNKSTQDTLKLTLPKCIPQLMLKEVTISFFSARIFPNSTDLSIKVCAAGERRSHT